MEFLHGHGCLAAAGTAGKARRLVEIEIAPGTSEELLEGLMTQFLASRNAT